MKQRTFLLTLAATLVLAAVLFFWRNTPYGEAQMHKGAGVLVSILESRFGRPRIEDWTAIQGLVVLGGQPSRFAEAFRLAEAHPNLRLVISGPSTYEMGLIAKAGPELAKRMLIERKSLAKYKSTYGNAVYSLELIRPAANERWLLVTSASHMPRAMGTFRKAGFPIESWPVQDNNGDPGTLLYVARHEWLGLIAYRILGRTDSLLPGGGPG